MRETAAAKARRYLTEGRLRILEADELGGIAQVEVRGDSGRVYACGWDSEGTFCDCAARSHDCAHLQALRLVALEPGEAA